MSTSNESNESNESNQTVHTGKITIPNSQLEGFGDFDLVIRWGPGEAYTSYEDAYDNWTLKAPKGASESYKRDIDFIIRVLRKELPEYWL